MAKPTGGLFDLLQAAAHAGLADLWKEVVADTEAENGATHILSHLARGASQHYGQKADQLAQQHGYEHRMNAPAPLRQQPTAAELWEAGLQTRRGGNHELAARYIGAAAAKGHARAMAFVANLFERGDGVEQDFHAAAEWYSRAVVAGERTAAPEALNRVAQRFQKGNGVLRDVATAVQHYRIAAEGGDPHAQFNLAWYLRHGKGGVAQDRDEARRLFRLSAGQGYAEAARELGEMEAEERARIGSGQQQQRPPPPRDSGTGMTRAQALEIIDMPEGSSPEARKAKWTRLMQQNHPDTGGSTYFAKQLNEARDVLGF